MAHDGGALTLRDELDGLLVTMLRHKPWWCSWRESAAVLGIARHSVCERFRKAGGSRRPGQGQPGR